VLVFLKRAFFRPFPPLLPAPVTNPVSLSPVSKAPSFFRTFVFFARPCESLWAKLLSNGPNSNLSGRHVILLFSLRERPYSRDRVILPRPSWLSPLLSSVFTVFFLEVSIAPPDLYLVQTARSVP